MLLAYRNLCMLDYRKIVTPPINGKITLPKLHVSTRKQRPKTISSDKHSTLIPLLDGQEVSFHLLVYFTGKLKYVSGYGSLLSVKCHHSLS
jgi:hypothetical protein